MWHGSSLSLVQNDIASFPHPDRHNLCKMQFPEYPSWCPDQTPGAIVKLRSQNKHRLIDGKDANNQSHTTTFASQWNKATVTTLHMIAQVSEMHRSHLPNTVIFFDSHPDLQKSTIPHRFQQGNNFPEGFSFSEQGQIKSRFTSLALGELSDNCLKGFPL